VRLWKKTSEGSISTVFVEKHPPFRQPPAWILTLVSVLTLRQMDGSLDFSLLLRDPPGQRRAVQTAPTVLRGKLPSLCTRGHVVGGCA
jgi:hypothetical protein